MVSQVISALGLVLMVVLPDMLVISQAVLDLLAEFAAVGGKIYVWKNLPTLLDGYPEADVIADKLAGAEKLTDIGLLQALNPDYKLITDDPTALLVNQRSLDDEKLFFIHNSDFQNAHRFELQIADMQLFEQRGGELYILPGNRGIVPEGGSSRLVAKKLTAPLVGQENAPICRRILDLSGDWQFAGHSEKNVLLMEFAQFRTKDCESWSDLYPILAIQQILTEQNYHGRVELKYLINCEQNFSDVALALEEADKFEIFLNGCKVPLAINGYYLCRDFQKVALPELRSGVNELILERDFAPLTKPTNALASLYEKLSGCELENCYLLGDFAVDCASEYTLTNCLRINPNAVLSAEKNTSNGNLTANGYPFYAGKIRLKKEFILPENAPNRALLKLPVPDAAAVTVEINGKKQGLAAWHPYTLEVDALQPGKNELVLELSSSLRNIIGPFHRPQGEYGSCFDGYSCPNLNWVGIREPDGTPIERWYDKRDVDSGSWCESYLQVRFGLSGDPVLEFK